jgi:hypothetical protein
MSRTFVALSFMLLMSSVGFAQQNPRDEAVELGKQGKDLYDRGRWSESRDRFSRADALVHSPVFVLYIARTLRNDGKLVAARVWFRTLAHETIPADAPAQWHDAKRDAEQELAEIEKRIPSIVITARPAGKSLSAKIDGALLAPEALTQPIEIDPGEHTLSLVEDGKSPVVRKLRAIEGEKSLEVVVELDTEVPVPPPPPPPVVPVIPPLAYTVSSIPPRPEGNAPLRRVGQASIVVGSFALGTSVGAAIATFVLRGPLAKVCHADLSCPRSESSALGSYNTAANVTTGTLVSGLILTGAGALMMGLAMPRAPKNPPVHVEAGASSLYVHGAF